MNFEDLNKLQKFCDNRVNYDVFEKAMLEQYDNVNYIKPLWEDFKNNPIKFITSRREKELFNFLINEIDRLQYKG